MAANFNNSAWFYDRLARLVYGRALINAQIYLLNYIPANSTLLIVGGGTGWILDELTRLHPTGLKITYVEVSAKMMALSKKRNTGSNEVIFINDAVESVTFNHEFDTALTPFLLDNFTAQNLAKIFPSINKPLKKDGLWLNCSFQLSGKWWQLLLLKTMFVFFKVICNIEASKLPDIYACFNNNEYKLIDQKKLFWGFYRVGSL